MTGFFAPDAFIYFEVNGKKHLVMSDLEILSLKVETLKLALAAQKLRSKAAERGAHLRRERVDAAPEVDRYLHGPAQAPKKKESEQRQRSGKTLSCAFVYVFTLSLRSMLLVQRELTVCKTVA